MLLGAKRNIAWEWTPLNSVVDKTVRKGISWATSTCNAACLSLSLFLLVKLSYFSLYSGISEYLVAGMSALFSGGSKNLVFVFLVLMMLILIAWDYKYLNFVQQHILKWRGGWSPNQGSPYRYWSLARAIVKPSLVFCFVIRNLAIWHNDPYVFRCGVQKSICSKINLFKHCPLGIAVKCTRR